MRPGLGKEPSSPDLQRTWRRAAGKRQSRGPRAGWRQSGPGPAGGRPGPGASPPPASGECSSSSARAAMFSGAVSSCISSGTAAAPQHQVDQAEMRQAHQSAGEQIAPGAEPIEHQHGVPSRPTSSVAVPEAQSTRWDAGDRAEALLAHDRQRPSGLCLVRGKEGRQKLAAHRRRLDQHRLDLGLALQDASGGEHARQQGADLAAARPRHQRDPQRPGRERACAARPRSPAA